MTAISTRDPARAINRAMVMVEGMAQPAIIPARRPEPTAAEPTTVFVYGSLKRGQPNHHWLAGAVGLGDARLERVQLFDLGPFPMAVAHPDATPGCCAPLQGELYQVDGATLAQLDRLEGVPRLYQRHWLGLSDGRSAWVYLGRPVQVRHGVPIASGHWSGPREARWWRSETQQ